MRRRLGYAAQAADGLTRRLVHPAERLRSYQQMLAQLSARLAFALAHRTHRCQAELERLRAALAGLDPAAILARGYSITYAGGERVLRDPAQARPGETLRTRLARGWLESEVKRRENS
jgi:exodeoxyribonuclease VII large subunit